jgi:hypothetical protein
MSKQEPTKSAPPASPGPASWLAPWHGGPPSPAQPAGKPTPPPSGPGRHYGEGSSSDFRDYVSPSGDISMTPRGRIP